MKLSIAFVTKPDTFWSKLVALIAGKPVHCAIFLNDKMMVESNTPNGVQFTNITHRDWLIVNVEITNMDSVMDFIKNEIGCAYDYKALFLGWTFGIQSNTKWFCSEFVADALRHGGIQLNHPSAWYTPKRLYNEIKIYDEI